MNDNSTMSPFGALLGIELLSSEPGAARCVLILKPEHMNKGGRVHGGVLSALADTAAGVAIRSVRPEGKASATTDLAISFLRPPTGLTLEADARVIHAGRRLIRTEVSLRSDTRLVARCSATFMLFGENNSSSQAT